MSAIIDALANARWNINIWRDPVLQKFLATGNESLVPKLPEFSEFSFAFSDEILAALPLPDKLDEVDKRFLRVCHLTKHRGGIGQWLQKSWEADVSGKQFTDGCRILEELGCPVVFIAQQIALKVDPLRGDDGEPKVPGQYLLSLEFQVMVDIILSGGLHDDRQEVLTGLFMAGERGKWKRILEALTKKGDFKPVRACAYVLALEAAPEEFADVCEKAWELTPYWNEKFAIAEKLFEVNPATYRPAMEKLAATQLLGEDPGPQTKAWAQARDAGLWLAAHGGEMAVPLLQDYFRIPLNEAAFNKKHQSEYKNEVLDSAFEKLHRGIVPLFEACFQTDQPDVQLHVLQLWTGIKTAEEVGNIAGKFRLLFASPESPVVSRAIRLTGEGFLETVEDDLWRLLSHKSRPVRDAAASALAKLGEQRLQKANELWTAKRADTRLATVAWLKAIGTAASAAVLKERLDDEEDDNVRDAILLALEKLPGRLAESDPSELKKRIKKALAKIQGTSIPWLDIKKLPRPKLADGSKLSTDHLRYRH